MQQSTLLSALEAVDWDRLLTTQGTAEAVPDWLLQLASDDPAWRFEGLQALWVACGPDTPVTEQIIPFLLMLLQDPATHHKDEILHLLASFVPPGQPELPSHALLAAALPQSGLPYLASDNPEVREAAFTLAARFPEFYPYLDDHLQQTVMRETDRDAQVRMLESYARFITEAVREQPVLLQQAAQWMSKFTEVDHPPLVRFHAGLYAARWYGPAMPECVVRVLAEAVAKPAAFAKYRSDLLYGPIVEQACDGLYRLERATAQARFLQLLKTIKDPEDAHTVAGYLLSLAFPNVQRRARYTALPPGYPAERPDNSAVKFRAWRATPEEIARKRAKGRLYPVAPRRSPNTPLLPEQRQVVEAILGCQVLWMLHSNLLEMIGLPAYRADAEAFL
jgi:hypothetical protein